jgi:putative FmdB family regulatory protein
MPVYSYQCNLCQFEFERKLPMTDNSLPESDPCPECFQPQCVKQTITSAPALGDPIRMGIKKPDAAWGEVLSKVKKAHPKGHWDNKKYVPSSGR